MNDEQPAEDYASFRAAPPINRFDAEDRLPAPNEPHWSIAGAVGFLLLSILAIVVLPTAAVLIYAAAKNIAPQNLLGDPNVVVVNLAAIFPAHLLTMWVGWLLITRRGQQPFWQTLGWHWTKNFNFLVCLALTVVLLAAGGSIIYVLGAPENDFQRILASSYAARVLAALMATLTAPLVEEVVYRGVLYPAFARKYGAANAIAFVTVIFALIHVPQYLDFQKLASVSSYSTIAVILLLSLTLTLIRARTNSLLPCFVIHTLFNGIQSVLLVIEPFIVPKGEAPTTIPKPDLFFVWQSWF